MKTNSLSVGDSVRFALNNGMHCYGRGTIKSIVQFRNQRSFDLDHLYLKGPHLGEDVLWIFPNEIIGRVAKRGPR